MRGWCGAGVALLGLAVGGPAAAQGFVLLSDLQDRYPTWDAATERVWLNSDPWALVELAEEAVADARVAGAEVYVERPTTSRPSVANGPGRSRWRSC